MKLKGVISSILIVFLNILWIQQLGLVQAQPSYESPLSAPISMPISTPFPTPSPTPTTVTLSAIPTYSVDGRRGITVTWSGIQNSTSKDWISLNSKSSGNRKDWFFLNTCSKSTALSLRPSGTCYIDLFSSLTPGEYELRMYANNSFTDLLAVSNTFIVTQAPALTTQVTVTQTSIVRGNTVTLSWNNLSTPTLKDWFGLYRAGAEDSDLKTWIFLGSCTKTATVTPAIAGSCALTVPSNVPAGTYVIRLFTNNSYNRIGLSNQFTVTQ